MVFAIFLSFSATSTLSEELFGVTNDGSFYKGAAPESSTNRLLIGESDWNSQLWVNLDLFLHPDGILYTLYLHLIRLFTKGHLPTLLNSLPFGRGLIVPRVFVAYHFQSTFRFPSLIRMENCML